MIYFIFYLSDQIPAGIGLLPSMRVVLDWFVVRMVGIINIVVLAVVDASEIIVVLGVVDASKINIYKDRTIFVNSCPCKLCRNVIKMKYICLFTLIQF